MVRADAAVSHPQVAQVLGAAIGVLAPPGRLPGLGLLLEGPLGVLHRGVGPVDGAQRLAGGVVGAVAGGSLPVQNLAVAQEAVGVDVDGHARVHLDWIGHGCVSFR